MKKITILLATVLLAACSQTETASAPPPPQAITEQAKGYYCTMNLTEHSGGKAQIFTESQPDKPYWFSTVNQAIGFTRHPGEPKDITAIYVTDMGKVSDWDNPHADNDWIDAKKAYYVIDSPFIGGMGTVDSLPFADLAKAQEFVQKKGGKIVSFDEVPNDFIYK